MIDFQDLAHWLERRHGPTCPKIIWLDHFPGPDIDALYCSGEGENPSHEPTIWLWKGLENAEFVFLHEFQHHIRRELEKKESPELKERWADYLAQCDLFKYLGEQMESAT